MDLGTLEDDHLLDIISSPQIYAIELWIETINIEKEHKTLGDSSDSSGDAVKSAEELPNTKNMSNSDAKNDSEMNKEKKKGKKPGREDYILPSGLKPLRVKFNIFDLKKVTITQIEFDKLFRFTCASESTILESDPSRGSTSINSLDAPSQELPTENAEEIPKTKSSDANKENEKNREGLRRNTETEVKFSNASKGSKASKASSEKGVPSSKSVLKTDVAKGGAEGSVKHLTIGPKEPVPGKENKFHLHPFRKSRTSDFIYNLDEILNIIDEDVFIPKNENTVQKGGCVTFALSPLEVIQWIQRGPLVLAVDRYGGRPDDEGDPLGEAKIYIPPEWKEIVLKMATEPLLAPEVEKMSTNTQIEDKTNGAIIGNMEFTLSLTCYAGCVISTGMPTQVGLYVAMAESKTDKPLCHKPTSRRNISYECVKKRALDEDYQIIFRPTKFI